MTESTTAFSFGTKKEFDVMQELLKHRVQSSDIMPGVVKIDTKVNRDNEVFPYKIEVFCDQSGLKKGDIALIEQVLSDAHDRYNEWSAGL